MSEEKTWSEVDSLRSLSSLIMEWATVGAIVTGAIYFDRLPVYLAAMVVMGAVQHRLAALGHEAAHGTLFPNRFWNDVIADVFCFFPVLGTVQNYRRWHLAHHASPNDPERDPDILNLGPWLLRDRFPMSRGRMVWLVFWRLISSPVCFIKYGFEYSKLNTLGLGKGLGPIAHYPRLYSPSVAMVLRLIVYGAVACVVTPFGVRGLWYFAVLWMIPLTTSLMYFLMLRDTFQHTNADAGRYTNTRVFRVNALMRWAVFPYGQDLHLPHHASPGVPHYRLEALHKHLLASRSAYQMGAVECRGVLWNRTGEPTITDVLTQGH